jgi:cation:H+ antiporter
MMALLFALGLLLIGTVLLVLGADWFVDGAEDLARVLGVSALVLGVVLAGLEPEEMLTAAIASARDAPSLAIGNVIGTNVTMATVALGLSALISPIVIDRRLRRQAVIATLVSALPIALLWLGVVTQLEGLLLLAVFVGYTLFLLRRDQRASKHRAERDGGEKTSARLRWKPVLLTFGGLAAMAIGGPALVEGALRLTRSLGLSQGVVGATIVSLGTGAEMIALGISAARKHQADILVGGILGSFAYNLLVTLGFAAVIHPLVREPQITLLALSVMIVVHLVLLALVWYGKIPRLVGALLVASYVAYLFAVVLTSREP